MGEDYLCKYKILQVLKETPKVLVLLAEHNQLNSYWIIKKLNKTSHLVRREVDMLKALRFPGIPMLADVFEEDEYLVIIKEYMPGVTLNHYFDQYRQETQSKGLHEETVLSIGRKLCRILEYLHNVPKHPIIYRDLKPGNIIINPQNEISLIDFGISRYFDGTKEHDTEYLGTKGFASPEQYGFSQSNKATDVFGVGAVMYYLLTGDDLGKPPYRIDRLREKRTDISLELVKTIEKACSISMDMRHGTVTELMNDLSFFHHNDYKTVFNSLVESYPGQVYVLDHLDEGAGSTYSALMLAKSLINNGHHPLLIDISGELGVLEYRMDTLYQGSILIYEGIHLLIYPNMKVNRGEAVNDLQSYDCLIIDVGGEEVPFNLDQEQIKYLTVAQLSPWKMELLEEAIFSQDDNQIFLINGCSSDEFDSYHISISQVKMYHIPFVPISIDKVSDVFHRINHEQGGFTLCSTGRSHLPRTFFQTRFLRNTKQ